MAKYYRRNKKQAPMKPIKNLRYLTWSPCQWRLSQSENTLGYNNYLEFLRIPDDHVQTKKEGSVHKAE